MSTANSPSIESPTIIPRPGSRLIWYILIAGIGLLLVANAVRIVIGQVVSEVETLGRNQMIDQNADYPQATWRPTDANFKYAQNTLPPVARLAQDPSQSSHPTGLTLANQISPQDSAENSAMAEINQLRNQLRSAGDDEKKAVRKSLTVAVGKLFDLRHAAQAKQVEKLEAELAEAKELHKKRGERKEEIVERRIAELLQSADDLAWNREIAGQPNAASNYVMPNSRYALPNSNYAVPNNRQTTPQNPNTLYYMVPTPSGGYQTIPYGTSPVDPNSIPPSSTPPQFIPLRAPDSGKTSPLNNAPEVARVPAEAPSNKIVQAENTNRELPTASTSVADSTLNSKAVIEIAYAYEEALEVAIERKRLAASGAVSSRELSTSKRNAAKAKAIWNSMLNELAARIAVKREELQGKEFQSQTVKDREKQAEFQIEISKLQVEYKWLDETRIWAEKFAKDSIETLEQQFAQSEEKKVNEKKSEIQ